ncbi:hypothetical protein [Acidicapsa ligni]|uniref:hypothetical protein n=1 Tax=Acidicapsa ligni TaxID=542300 RepID=UPI0021DFD065|nr:hypothetical protein [Acidicapsa ligni]
MRLRWLIPIALLIPLRATASNGDPSGRVVTLTLQQGSITTLHLRPEFESIIHLPEEVTSVVVGSPGSFKVEHSEGEPEYVYVKPLIRTRSQSDLLIATKSGRHIVLELISDGGNAPTAQPVDFLLEYHSPRSLLVAGSPVTETARPSAAEPAAVSKATRSPKALSAIDVEFEQQKSVNAPGWKAWDGQQIKTAIGDIRQWNNQTAISYSVFNASDKPVEIVPPQIQITGLTFDKKKKKKKKAGILADQLEISDYRLSTTRLEPGGRADGVVVFDRPNFKQSTEKLFLQIAQADQVDKPVLVQLPFTPPISANGR